MHVHVYGYKYATTCSHLIHQLCFIHSFTTCRKPKLPIEMEGKQSVNDENSWDPDDILRDAAAMSNLKEKIYATAKGNIDKAQQKDKYYYDKKHSDMRVRSNC